MEEADEATGGKGAPIFESGVDPEMMFSGEVAAAARDVAAAARSAAGGGVGMEVPGGVLKIQVNIIKKNIMY